MHYMPIVKSMNRIGGAPLGDSHEVVMFDNIKSAGSMQYTYLLGVFDNAKQKPVYYVASEVNQMAAVFGGGSHCLGVFDGSGHANLGFSDDWGDPDKFFPKALRIASEQFGVPFDDLPALPTITTPAGKAARPKRKLATPARKVSQPIHKPWWRFWG